MRAAALLTTNNSGLGSFEAKLRNLIARPLHRSPTQKGQKHRVGLNPAVSLEGHLLKLFATYVQAGRAIRATMLRLAGRGIARRLVEARSFSFSAGALADESSSDKGPKAFVDRFTPHVSSNLAQPQFQSDFIPEAKEDAKEGVPEKLTLNLYMPYKHELKDSKVEHEKSCTRLPPDHCWHIEA